MRINKLRDAREIGYNQPRGRLRLHRPSDRSLCLQDRPYRLVFSASMKVQSNPFPFIADQRLYRLNTSDGVPRSLKRTLSLTGLPEFEALDRAFQEWDREAENSEAWVTIDTSAERARFLRDLGDRTDSTSSSRTLLCITSSAGIGKSKAIEQVKYLRSSLPDHWVISYHFGKLPVHEKGYWGNGNSDSTSDPIYKRVEMVLEPTKKRPFAPLEIDALELFLKLKMAEGKVTLVVDGLDEHDPEHGVSRAIALRKFLKEHPEVHCVVAGRPYAITDAYWNALFKTTEYEQEDDTSPWQFCCVGMFTRDQIRLSLGDKRANQIFALASDLSLTPRTIEVLRTLKEDSFTRIKNLSDVYWESLNGTITEDVLRERKGLATPLLVGITAPSYVEYACALAITMFNLGEREVSYQDIEGELLTRLQSLQKWRCDDESSLEEKKKSIAALNAGAIEFRFYEALDSKVIWRNKTLRDFFAALWMVRYSSEAELEEFASRIPKRFLYTDIDSIHPEGQETWSFLSSMPSRALLGSTTGRKHSRWLRIIQRAFQQPERDPRPTEIMWYAWKRLSALIEEDKDGKAYRDVNPTPVSIRNNFLSEFDHVAGSGNGKAIAEEDLIFETIKPLDDGSWEVAVGHPDEKSNQPRTVTLDGTYLVCKYPVTRRIYKLFDPNHEIVFHSNFSMFSKEDRCPVINITWYDAKMFSIWSQSRLLSEWEWEYACRGNHDAEAHRKSTHWHSDPKNDTEREKVAWISSNSQDRTWPVDAKQDESHTNAFGLVDMLGNVWEWTESTYEAGKVSRVLRGGSFNFIGRYASASFRIHFDPSLTNFNYGFRVARAREGKS